MSVGSCLTNTPAPVAHSHVNPTTNHVSCECQQLTKTHLCGEAPELGPLDLRPYVNRGSCGCSLVFEAEAKLSFRHRTALEC